jgi:hypothetical protein
MAFNDHTIFFVVNYKYFNTIKDDLRGVLI